MATYSRQLLSGSTNGQPVKVAATAIGSGTTIHTAVSGTSSFDEIYLWVTNTSSSAVALTIGWGGTTDPDSLVCDAVTIPPSSDCPPIPIVAGLVLQNSLIVKAAAGTTNVLLLTGYVNRIA
jgi:hypothetical protein